jgi:hypothetical protein
MWQFNSSIVTSSSFSLFRSLSRALMMRDIVSGFVKNDIHDSWYYVSGSVSVHPDLGNAKALNKLLK